MYGTTRRAEPKDATVRRETDSVLPEGLRPHPTPGRVGQRERNPHSPMGQVADLDLFVLVDNCQSRAVRAEAEAIADAIVCGGHVEAH